MRALVGGRDAELTADEFDLRVERFSRVVIDVGTGDGRYAYSLASARPDVFVVGIDAAADSMRELSRKAARKPAKGGLGNVLYVVAAVESPPVGLVGRAGEVHVILPWGSLLRGAVLADPAVVGPLRSLCAPGASVDIVFNAALWPGAAPLDTLDLPALTPEYALDTLRGAYLPLGLRIDEAHAMGLEEARAVDTTWAKRLRHGRVPQFLAVHAVAVDAAAAGLAPPRTTT